MPAAKYLALIAFSLTIFGAVTPEIVMADGSQPGKSGDIGDAGKSGSRGNIGGIEKWYVRYPLCSLSRLIAAAGDEQKLSEYLGADCSVVQSTKASPESMFDLSVIRQERGLIRMIVNDSKAQTEVANIPTMRVPRVDRFKNSNLPLSYLEYTIFYRSYDEESGKLLDEPLYVDASQAEIIGYLVSVVDDVDKLKSVTEQAVLKLKQSPYYNAPSVLNAIASIENRINELSK